MWTDTWIDWAILLSGYVLALGIFRFLGGFPAAGAALRTWGERQAERRGKTGTSS